MTKVQKLEARVKELERRVEVLYALTLVMRGIHPKHDKRYRDLFDGITKLEAQRKREAEDCI